MTHQEPAIRAADLTKTYGAGDTEVLALAGIEVAVERGTFTAIMGPSGSGKSTLMHCLAGLDRPTGGRVWLGGTDLTELSEDALTTLRRDRIGFVFQAFNLLPTLTAAENIVLPLTLAGRRPDPEALATIAGRLGLRDRLRHRPGQLSGGQQQRVACARALITAPDVIFADEPTGALDLASSDELLRLLRHSVDELHQTLVVVTHDATVAARADRVLFLADGRLVDDLAAPTTSAVLDRMKHLERRAA